MGNLSADIVVVGASLGGCAAAIRAAASGVRVLLLAKGDWVGGQFTSQGVCTPDENQWIESGGANASYLRFRQACRDHYAANYRLSQLAKEQPNLNIGQCWVSRMAVEPRVAQQILLEMLQGVEILHRVEVLSAEVENDRIGAITVSIDGGEAVTVSGKMFLDATDMGDLLPIVGAEYRVGAESREETGEPDAPEVARPDWVQPVTFPFALELCPRGEDHTIAKPPNYEEHRVRQHYHILDGAMRGMFGELGWWTYRRVVAAEMFDDPAFPHDVAMINTCSNDYCSDNSCLNNDSPRSREEWLEQARQASLGYVYWLQTECQREDEPGQFGYPEFKLRGDWFGTEDGLSPEPYVRESRRIVARKTIVEQEIVQKDASGWEWQVGPRAELFPDSVGIGHYWLDIHANGAGEEHLFLETRPFQIPLGALIPVRLRNLLPACKNLGVTHLTNGAYRLHPIEWAIGEAAGALAAFCINEQTEPSEVLDSPAMLSQFQNVLLESGVPLEW